MLEQFKQWLEIDALRWEDAIQSRNEWVRRGWATADQVQQEIAWFTARAADSRFLLALS